MVEYRIGQAAELLGVSPDTVTAMGRRRSDQGDGRGRRPPLRRWARIWPSSPSRSPATRAGPSPRAVGAQPLPRDRDRVVKDKVAAQVEIQAGPHRFVALITREAADELELAPGVVADAVVKATNVGVEIPAQL